MPESANNKLGVKQTRIPDNDGNEIIATESNGYIQMHLQLKLEKRPRFLGVIEKRTGFFFVERRRAEHLFYKYNAYGFNYAILDKAKTFDYVCLTDEEGAWQIPVDFILNKDNHEFLHFKGQGFERQVFISLELMEQFRRPPAY